MLQYIYSCKAMIQSFQKYGDWLSKQNYVVRLNFRNASPFGIEIDAEHTSGHHTKYSIESGKITVIQHVLKGEDAELFDPISHLLLTSANGAQVASSVKGNKPNEVRDYVFNGMPIILRENQLEEYMSNQ